MSETFDYRDFLSPEVEDRVDALELPFNKHGIDPYGVSKSDLALFFSVLGKAYKDYFHVQVFGRENVPKSGRGMLIGNHSGGVAIDGAMVIAACFFELDPPRLAQGMIEKFLSRMPGAAQILGKAGQLTGLPEHCIRLLREERLLMIFPEGARGTAKLYHESDSLVRFGTGFMRLALETKTPIVPFGFVGGGEAFPTILNLYGLGKALGLPYIPVPRYLLPVPRPATFQLLFGEPMLFEGTGRESDEEILVHVEKVRDRIAGLIEQGRKIREGSLDPAALELGDTSRDHGRADR